MNSRVLVISILALAVFAAIPGTSWAQNAGTSDVVDLAGPAGKVDWTAGMVTAVGIGAPPSQPANPAQGRAVADRDAQAAAYRNMLEAVKAVRVDSSATIGNLIGSSDVIKTQVNGVIQGALIMDKKYMPDGSIEVTVGMRLTGALSETVLPKTASAAPMAAGPATGEAYTGLIVDACGLSARPAMSPRILSEDGREVYGSASAKRDCEVREGMAGYLKDLAAARVDPRVADKPLVIKAVKISGEARVDIVISNADAAAIRGTAQNMLEKCKVIIVID